MKCPYCKETDTKFDHEFKNKVMLETHIKHKHPSEVEPVEPVELVEPIGNTEPTLEELGFNKPEPEQQEVKIFMCSECGAEVEGQPAECPNCREPFD